MKKVVEKYFSMHNMYPKVELKIWSFTSKITTWSARLLNQLDTFVEFHFYQEWKLGLNEEDAHPKSEGMGS
jgi:hypothetical protein